MLIYKIGIMKLFFEIFVMMDFVLLKVFKMKVMKDCFLFLFVESIKKK